MPNPTAPRAPAEQVASSDRALALRERLDSAANEDLSANITRFLRFLGHADGDVIELQALGVPGKYAPVQRSSDSEWEKTARIEITNV